MRVQRFVWFSNLWDLQVQLPLISSWNVCVYIFFFKSSFPFFFLGYFTIVLFLISFVTGSFIWQKSCLPFSSCQYLFWNRGIIQLRFKSHWSWYQKLGTPQNGLDTSFSIKRGFFNMHFLCIRTYWQCRFWFWVFAFMLYWKNVSVWKLPHLKNAKNWFY